eukprot:6184112-Pleurochrysis_carterae.AAC.2
MSASRCTAATRAASSLAMAVRTQPRLERLALIAPQQGVTWTYGELDQRCRSLARGLREVGVAKGSFAVSDLPNVCENLVLQLALAHLGASIATVKDAEGLAKLCDRETVCVALSSSRSSFLASAELKAPPIILAESSDEDIKPGSLLFQEVSSAPADTADALAREDGLMGVYNGASLTHGTALSLARDAAAHLQTTPDDRACARSRPSARPRAYERPNAQGASCPDCKERLHTCSTHLEQHTAPRLLEAYMRLILHILFVGYVCIQPLQRG